MPREDWVAVVVTIVMAAWLGYGLAFVLGHLIR